MISTHVVSDIESIAERDHPPRDGQIIDQGTVSGLCKKYGNVKNLEQVYLEVFEEEEESDGAHRI